MLLGPVVVARLTQILKVSALACKLYFVKPLYRRRLKNACRVGRQRLELWVALVLRCLCVWGGGVRRGGWGEGGCVGERCIRGMLCEIGQRSYRID